MIHFVRFLGGPWDGRTLRRDHVENDGSLPSRWFIPTVMAGDESSLFTDDVAFGLTTYVLSTVADEDGTPLYRFEEKP